MVTDTRHQWRVVVIIRISSERPRWCVPIQAATLSFCPSVCAVLLSMAQEPIHEHVPVFEGKFRIVYKIRINSSRTFIASLGNGKELAVTGELNYQA